MESLKGLSEVITRHVPDEIALDETIKCQLTAVAIAGALPDILKNFTSEEFEKIVYERLKAKYEKDS